MLGVQTAMPTMTKCTLYLEEACCIATHRCAGHKLTGMVSCTLPGELNECPVQDVEGAIGHAPAGAADWQLDTKWVHER